MTNAELPRAFCISRRLGSPAWPTSRLSELNGRKPSGIRWPETQKHLLAMGIAAEPFWCIDWQISGLETTHFYEVDHPGSRFKTHPMRICNCLSQYLLWRVCEYLPGDEFLVLEDDVRFREDWRAAYEQARAHLPSDWDMLFLGSCNCQGKQVAQHGPNLFTIHWPQCTHAYIVRKKALPVLSETMQKLWAPIDLALGFDAFPHLHVYTILPRIADQFETNIDP